MLKKIAMAALTVAAIVPTFSHASDGTITFDGLVESNTCTISGDGGGKDFTVTLPTVQASALATVGAAAGLKTFTVKLSNCTWTTGNVALYFDGGMFDATTNNLKNTANAAGSTTYATNVQVQLLNADGTTPILVGTHDGTAAGQNSQAVALTASGSPAAGSATLTYHAQYVATGAVTAGQVRTNVMYTLMHI